MDRREDVNDKRTPCVILPIMPVWMFYLLPGVGLGCCFIRSRSVRGNTSLRYIISCYVATLDNAFSPDVPVPGRCQWRRKKKCGVCVGSGIPEVGTSASERGAAVVSPESLYSTEPVDHASTNDTSAHDYRSNNAAGL
jgi:hypothetical protein